MIPIQLKLRNFMSYRDEATLDFATIRVACLAGDNGAGKSALLDAITWAIWGKTRASNDREVVALGEIEMDVTFIFQLRDREYRVYRRRTFGARAKPTLEFDVRETGADEWVPITGDDIRATEQKIVATLNLDYETFVNSAFILQGRADTFTQKTAGERKRILADILNLGEYDELAKQAREEERELKQALARARGELDAFERRLAERPERMAESNALSAQLNAVGGQLDLARDLARSLEGQLHVYERIAALLKTTRQRLEREQASLGGIEAGLRAQRVERERFAAVLSAADEIERGVAEHERWRAAAARYATTLREVQTQIAAQNAADKELRDARNDLQRQRDRAEASRATAVAALERLARADEQLAALRADLAGADEVTAKLAACRQALQDRQHERTTLHTQNQQHKAKMDEIRASLDLLEKGEADCPTCRRPLSAADRDHVRATWTADGTALGNVFRANRERMKAIEGELAVLADDQRRLEDDDREYAQQRGMLGQLLAGQAERPAHERQASESAAELARLDAALAADDYAHEARARWQAAEAALETLAYDPAAHEQAEKQERALQPFLLRKQELETARAQLASVEQQLVTLETQRAEFQEAVAATTAEVAELAGQLGGETDLRERFDAARDAADQLEARRNDLQGQLGGVARALAELDRDEEQRDALVASTQATALEIGALGELVRAFGRDGIQAMIVENVLPELEEEANAILRRMSSSQLQVSFRSQREALSSDKSIETLDIIIRDEYGERPYALYSGGEAFRVNFAVRVALSKLLARRAGARIDVLVVDEGFGTQDARGRDGLIEALHSIEEEFSTIIVITHIGEIRDLFPTRIDIVKTDRGSMISVN